MALDAILDDTNHKWHNRQDNMKRSTSHSWKLRFNRVTAKSFLVANASILRGVLIGALLLRMVITSAAKPGVEVTGTCKAQLTSKDITDICTLAHTRCGSEPWRIEANQGLGCEEKIGNKEKVTSSIGCIVFITPSSAGKRIQRGAFATCNTVPPWFPAVPPRDVRLNGRWQFSQMGHYALVLPVNQKAGFYNVPFVVNEDVPSDAVVAVVDSLYKLLTGKQTELCDDEAGLRSSTPAPLSRRIGNVGKNGIGEKLKDGQLSLVFQPDNNGEFLYFLFEQKNGHWYCSVVNDVQT